MVVRDEKMQEIKDTSSSHLKQDQPQAQRSSLSPELRAELSRIIERNRAGFEYLSQH